MGWRDIGLDEEIGFDEAQAANAQGVKGFLGSFVVSSPFSPRVLARSLLENFVPLFSASIKSQVMRSCCLPP